MVNEPGILRVSGKLGEKIDISPDEKLPMHENSYLDWSAHLFRAPRTQYILLVNTASLYSILLRGRGITNENEYLQRVTNRLDEMLRKEEFQSIYKKIITPGLEEHQFGKALNRSVIGSMNDIVKHAKSYLGKWGLSLFEASQRVNEIPFSTLDYQKPREVFRNLQSGAD